MALTAEQMVESVKSDPSFTKTVENGKVIYRQKGTYTNIISDKGTYRRTPRTFTRREYIIENGKVTENRYDTRLTYRTSHGEERYTPYKIEQRVYQQGQLVGHRGWEERGIGKSVRPVDYGAQEQIPLDKPGAKRVEHLPGQEPRVIETSRAKDLTYEGKKGETLVSAAEARRKEAAKEAKGVPAYYEVEYKGKKYPTPKKDYLPLAYRQDVELAEGMYESLTTKQRQAAERKATIPKGKEAVPITKPPMRFLKEAKPPTFYQKLEYKATKDPQKYGLLIAGAAFAKTTIEWGTAPYRPGTYVDLYKMVRDPLGTKRELSLMALEFGQELRIMPTKAVGKVAGAYVGAKIGALPIKAISRRIALRRSMAKEIKKLPKKKQAQFKEYLEVEKTIEGVKPPVKKITLKGMERVPPKARPIVIQTLVKQKKSDIVGGSVAQRTQIYGKDIKPSDIDIYTKKSPIAQAENLAKELEKGGVERVSVIRKKRGLPGEKGEITIKGKKAIEFHRREFFEANVRQIQLWGSGVTETPRGVRVMEVSAQMKRKLFASMTDPSRYSKDMPHFKRIAGSIIKTAEIEAGKRTIPYFKERRLEELKAAKARLEGKPYTPKDITFFKPIGKRGEAFIPAGIPKDLKAVEYSYRIGGKGGPLKAPKISKRKLVHKPKVTKYKPIKYKKPRVPYAKPYVPPRATPTIYPTPAKPYKPPVIPTPYKPIVTPYKKPITPEPKVIPPYKISIPKKPVPYAPAKAPYKTPIIPSYKVPSIKTPFPYPAPYKAPRPPSVKTFPPIEMKEVTEKEKKKIRKMKERKYLYTPNIISLELGLIAPVKKPLKRFAPIEIRKIPKEFKKEYEELISIGKWKK